MIRYTALFSAVLGNQAPKGLLFFRLLPRRAVWGAILSYSFLSFYRLVFHALPLGQALPTASILPSAAASLLRHCLVLAYFGAGLFKPLPFGLAACGVSDGAAAFSRGVVVPTQATPFSGLLQSFIFFPTCFSSLVTSALGHHRLGAWLFKPFLFRFDICGVPNGAAYFSSYGRPNTGHPLFWTFQSFKFSLFMRRCSRLATPALG